MGGGRRQGDRGMLGWTRGAVGSFRMTIALVEGGNEETCASKSMSHKGNAVKCVREMRMATTW